MKLIKLATQIIFLFYAIEASEYPQRKELPLFKVDDSVIDDIYDILQLSEEQKVQNLHKIRMYNNGLGISFFSVGM